MWWRVFDHLSFAMTCCGVAFCLAMGGGFDEILGFFLMGFIWTAYHSHEFSKRADYRMSIMARRMAVLFYGLALICLLYSAFILSA
jgi:hypothetical protein